MHYFGMLQFTTVPQCVHIRNAILPLIVARIRNAILLLVVARIRNAKLQRENGELKGEVKSLRHKVKGLERNDFSSTLRAELEHTHAASSTEIRSLRKQVHTHNRDSNC